MDLREHSSYVLIAAEWKIVICTMVSIICKGSRKR